MLRRFPHTSKISPLRNRWTRCGRGAKRQGQSGRSRDESSSREPSIISSSMPAEIGDTLNTSRPCEWRSFLMQNGGSLDKLTAAAAHKSSRGWSIFSEHSNGERTRLVPSAGRVRALSPNDEFNQVTLERSSASWVLGLADAPIMICDDRPTPRANSSGETSRPQPTQSRLAAKALSKKKVVSNAKARKSGGASVKPGVPTSAERVALDSDADFFASLAPSTGATSQDPRDLLRRLRAYLEPPRDLPETVPSSMWTAFVQSVFRIVVLRVPALATLALTPITFVAAEEAAIKPCGGRRRRRRMLGTAPAAGISSVECSSLPRPARRPTRPGRPNRRRYRRRCALAGTQVCQKQVGQG